ncbi:hypothetical protein [Thalassotalea sediminis]|uniref:hypothetical protein n=1 Tax=Thalassotalea sediminis TaxID=1759089 RepID=UPI0025745952|nr:hypothetical protein [Thalassotalea sediminis]
MEERSVIKVGGDLEKAINGDYKIDVKSVLTEAWESTKRSRTAINIGLLFVFILGVTISLVVSQYFGGIEVVLQNQQQSALLNIIVTLVVYPFLVGVEMMGIYHAIGLKTHPKLVFGFLKRGSWVAICALFTSTIIALGMALYYLPGIYLAVALSLVLPLVVEKRLSPMKAILISLKATRHQWFAIFSIYLVLMLLLVASFLPLVIFAKSSISLVGGIMTIFALTYLAPLFYNVKGVLYREIFGMQVTLQKGSDSPVDSTFSA